MASYLTFSLGFQIPNDSLIDKRLVMTKAEMLAINPKYYPEKYFCVCSDDGEIYVYDKTVTPSAETGRFANALLGVRGNISDLQDAVEALNTALENDVVKKDELESEVSDILPAALLKSLEEQPELLEPAIGKVLPGAIADVMSDPTSQTAQELTAAVALTVPDALDKAMQTEGGAEKIADALFSSEHFDVGLDNKIDLSLSLIQAIDGND